MYMSKIGLFSLLLAKPTVTTAQAYSNDFFFLTERQLFSPFTFPRGLYSQA